MRLQDEIKRHLPSSIEEREDSRAFGALVEDLIKKRWKAICESVGAKPLEEGGRKTIYDLAFKYREWNWGFDIRTKTKEGDKYSDGGVCSVKNLLIFLEKRWLLIVIEIEHQPDTQNRGKRKIENVVVIPFHVLPKDIYRIENLGTGQIRFNQPLSEVISRVEWGRNMIDFLDFIEEKAKTHYKNVAKKAQDMILKVEKRVGSLRQRWQKLTS